MGTTGSSIRQYQKDLSIGFGPRAHSRKQGSSLDWMLSKSKDDYLIRYLNNSYLNIERYEVGLMLQLENKQQSVIISQGREVFVHFHGLENALIFSLQTDIIMMILFLFCSTTVTNARLRLVFYDSIYIQQENTAASL